MNKLKRLALLFSAFCIPGVYAAPAINFHVVLSGDQEVPPVETVTSGMANLHIDQGRSQIRFDMTIKNAEDILGLAGAHFHCAPAGENGPVVAFLAGQTPPGFDGRVDLKATLTDENIINDACGATIEELVDSMLEGNVYVNVHSVANPGGEIRGQVE